MDTVKTSTSVESTHLKLGPPSLALSTWHGWVWHRDGYGQPLIPGNARPSHFPDLTLTFQPKGIAPVSIPAKELGTTLAAQAHYNHTVLESTWANRLVLAGFRAAVKAIMRVQV